MIRLNKEGAIERTEKMIQFSRGRIEGFSEEILGMTAKINGDVEETMKSILGNLNETQKILESYIQK